jgi:hypothetical protein
MWYEPFKMLLRMTYFGLCGLEKRNLCILMQPEKKTVAQDVLVTLENPGNFRDQKRSFYVFYAIRSPMIKRHQKSHAFNL